MRRYIFLLCMASLPRCGEAPANFETSIHISQEIAQITRSLDIYILSKQYEPNGTKRTLTCDDLMAFSVFPTSNGVTVLGGANVPFGNNSARSIAIDAVANGKNRIVFIEAHDSASQKIGRGCIAGIAVPPGDTVNVTVRVIACGPSLCQ